VDSRHRDGPLPSTDGCRPCRLEDVRPPFGHQSLRQELLQLVVHIAVTGAVAFGLFPLQRQRPNTLQEGDLFAQGQGLLQGLAAFVFAPIAIDSGLPLRGSVRRMSCP